mmetsp:Transcript_95503/g.204955  ORF Transcript_95503/g.204955 Transcript_95503/m.204955 type:complete len:246 (-) Transcript_95503:329-1066(-)
MPSPVTSSTRVASSLSDSSAPASAEPRIRAASATKSRSPLRPIAASPSASPLYFTASRMSSLSCRSSSVANLMACPRLDMRAADMRERSPRMSSGARFSNCQSKVIAARYCAWRQLLTHSAPTPSLGMPSFLAAKDKACMSTEDSANSSMLSSTGRFLFCFASLNKSSRTSFSSLGKSSCKARSLRIAFELRWWNISAACAAARRKRPAMSRMLAARRMPKSSSRGTFTKLASNFATPHSSRSSL